MPTPGTKYTDDTVPLEDISQKIKAKAHVEKHPATRGGLDSKTPRPKLTKQGL